MRIFKRQHPILRRLIIGLCVCVVLVGLLMASFGWVMRQAPAYRTQVQTWLSARAKLHIEFSQIRARWRWYGPELEFDHAVVRSADQQRILVMAERGGVGFDIWAVIRSGRLSAARFSLSGTELKVVRTVEGQLVLIGQEDLPEFDHMESLQADALPIGQLSVRNVRLSFYDLKTSRGPWMIRDVQIDAERSPTRINIEGQARLPGTLGKALRFSAQSKGRLKDVHAVQWRAQVSGVELDLAGWAQIMPQDWLAPKVGTGSFQISAAFRGAELEKCSGVLNFAHVNLTLPQWSLALPQAEALQLRDVLTAELSVEHAAASAKPVTMPASVQYDRLGAEFVVTRQVGGWQAKISQLQLLRANVAWQPSQAEINVYTPVTGGTQVTADVSHLVLENLWPLLAFLPEQPRYANLRALAAQGSIDALHVEYDANPAATARFKLTAQLGRVRWAAIRKTPGIAGLSGEVSMTDSEGQLTLDSTELVFSWPYVFRQDLDVDQLKGVLRWQRIERAWQVSASEFSLDSKDGHVVAAGALRIPDVGSPMIDLQAEAKDLDALAAPRYMPAGKLSTTALSWLDHAFTAGRVSHAALTLRGPVQYFPFRHDEGLFLIKAQIAGLTLDYKPGWMPATQINVAAEFRNTGFSATADAAVLNSLQVEHAFARIKDFRTPVLEVRATGQGALQNALEYVQHSSIAPVLGETFQSLQGTGTVQAAIDLLMPLQHSETYSMTLDTQVQDATVALAGVQQPATDVQGTIQVRKQGVTKMLLQGQFLNGEFKVDTEGTAKSPVFVATGRAHATELTRVLQLPSFIQLRGATDWRLTTALRFAAGRTTQAQLFTLDTDLQGLGIELPAPVFKAPAETRALHVEIERPAVNALLLRGALGSLRALVNMQKTPQGWHFDRAGLRADGVPASLPAHAGLRIEGALENFVLDDWLNLRARTGQPATTQARAVNEILRAANMTIEHFVLWGYQWSDVRGVLQAAETGWQVDVSGPDIAGQIYIPYQFDGTRALTLQLDQLLLNSVKEKTPGKSGAAVDPRDIPALDVEIKHFKYGEHDFGAVRAQAQRIAQGLKVDELRAVADSFTGNGSGMWVMTPTGQHTHLLLDMESHNLRHALRQLHYADVIAAKHSKLHADLQWPGGLDEAWLDRSSGIIRIQAEDGQLLNVQPGAGRILGLLSLAALPRRIALDFRDLTDKGMRFDRIQGDFKVTVGDAYTENLLLRGPAAEIGMAGRIGFAHRDYDQTAIVTGSLGASLPIAATFAGGPVVGTAVLLFTQIFKEPLKGVARGYYRITGSWDDPLIERIDSAAAKETAKEAQPPPAAQPITP